MMNNFHSWILLYPFNLKMNSFETCLLPEHHEHSDVRETAVVNRSTNGIGFWLTTQIKESVEEFSWIGSCFLHAAPVDVGKIRWLIDWRNNISRNRVAVYVPNLGRCKNDGNTFGIEDTMTPDKLETRVNALNEEMPIYIF